MREKSGVRVMFEIRVKNEFSAAHNLKNYKGKCENLHGHNWAVETVFAYDAVDKDGLAIDFRRARKLVNNAIEKLDHAYLNKLEAMKGINPTSENVAKFIYDSVKRRNKKIRSVSVWENERSCTTYSEVTPAR